jgi:hypothetical protein
VHRSDVCALSGLAPGAACPRRASEWLPRDAAIPACTWHHASDEGLVTVWPDAYRPWAMREGLLAAPTTPAPRATGAGAPARAAAAATFAIAEPIAGAIFLIDPTLRPEFQTLSLRARGAAPGAVEWRVDGDVVGRALSSDAVRWPLRRGAHVIRARDAAGRVAEAEVVVR